LVELEEFLFSDTAICYILNTSIPAS